MARELRRWDEGQHTSYGERWLEVKALGRNIAATVTRAAVRCSAWLGRVGSRSEIPEAEKATIVRIIDLTEPVEYGKPLTQRPLTYAEMQEHLSARKGRL